MKSPNKNSKASQKTKASAKPRGSKPLQRGRLPSLAKRQEHCREILRRLEKIEPHPKTELFFLNPFQLLVSVVLSAQTTDKMVNKCMEPLYRSGLTPDTILEWGPEGLLQRIRTIGLAPTKSKNVHKLAGIIKEKYKGEIPRTREELEALPGVGRKTANVILGEVFREPTIAVDTHGYRVPARLGLQRESSPEKAELELLKVIDRDQLPGAHHWFILHGRYTCKAPRPDCEQCVLNDICPSAEISVIPSKKAVILSKAKDLKSTVPAIQVKG